MVHSRVNKWSTFCFEFLEADVDHLLTLEFCFKVLVFKLDLFSIIAVSLQKEVEKKKKTPKKCERKMWTTY